MPVNKLGAEFRINSVAFQTQNSPDIAALADGGFVIVWDDNSGQNLGDVSDNAYTEVKAQRYSSTGAAAGDEFRVNVNVVDEQDNAGVAALPGGGFAVAFEDGSDATVGGTYITVRAFDAASTPITGDLRISRGSGDYLASNPQPAVLSDGSLIVVHGSEDTGVGQEVLLPSGGTVGLFVLGGVYEETAVDYAQSLVTEGVTPLAGNRFVHVYQGHRTDIGGNPELDGVIVWIREADGVPDGDPFQANDPSGGTATAPAVTTLVDGRFVVTWTSFATPPFEGGTGDVFARIFAADGTSESGPFLVSSVTAGSQSGTDVAALLDGGFVVSWRDESGVGGDASGGGIKARVFAADGTAAEEEFLVNTVTAGPQGDAHIATLADGRFVISWTDAGAAGGADVKAQIFSLAPALPDCPVLARLGTQDGSLAIDQTLTGPDGANSFFLSSQSGHDSIANFEKVDVLVTDAALRDGNRDGLIAFGADGLLGLGEDDTVAILGIDPNAGLRSLGESCEGIFVYADASVRPKSAREGSLGDDVLAGDTGDNSAQTFFFDTALGLDLGSDKITRFGAKDLFVTTSKIADQNDDGVIRFGADKTLDLPNEGGTVVINAKAISVLEFDGAVLHDGVEYFVYSLMGSANAGTDDLLFT